MSGGTQQSQLDIRLRRYRALCEVAESIAAHHDFTSLLQDLKERLQLVVKFDAAQVVLHDPEQNLLRRHVLKSTAPARDNLISELTIEEAPSGWVWQTQQPMLITDLEASESRYPRIVAEMRERSVKTVYILPLTSLDRRLGTLGFTSRQAAAWGEDDQEFLQQVAKLVAVAVDNAINFEDARAAETELRRRLEQLRLMLKITTAVVSQLELHELLKVISSSIREAIAMDLVTVSLFDYQSGQLRTTAIDATSGSRLRPIGFVLPLEGTPGGLAFTSGQPVLQDRLDVDEFPSAVFRQVYEEGYRSGGSIPLIAQGRKLGVLGFACKREYGFSDDDKELLGQIANQIAIAVDNSLNFERARQAEQEIRRQFERERLMLEINNAVVSNLNLPGLLAAISAGLRRVLSHDFAGMALYDEVSGHLRVQALDSVRNQELFGGDHFIPLKGTAAGKAFTSRQTVLLRRFEAAGSSIPVVNIVGTAGFKSSCHVPLISRGQALGTLDVMSYREDAFTEEDAELLTQVGNQIAIAVENALNFERARQAEQEIRRQFERERLILEINNAVVSQLSLRELVRVTSSRLRKVLETDVTGISLYDPETNQFRAYMFDLPDNMPAIEEGTAMPLEGTVGGLAFKSGKAVFMNHPDPEISTGEFDRRMIEAGVRSGGVVPLIAHDRKLGFLGVGSFREDAFSEADQELLCHIANQIAIAVENALNFERARVAEQVAKRQSDRLSQVLRVNNAVVAQLDLRELLRVVLDSLRSGLHHDTASVALYDPESDKLRLVVTDFPEQMRLVEESYLVPLEGSVMGLAFTTGEPVCLEQYDLQRFPSDFTVRSYEAGLRSCVNLPLIAHGRKLGALGVASKRPAAFSTEDVELLCQSAKQIAIAVENALAFREIEALKNKLASEKLYLEDEIRTEHNFEELIGESKSFKRILRQIETVAPTDSTVLIRGETGTGKELLARAIHDLSARRARTLVKLNCAAIPTGLLESELFGHEKGAFTGAISQRIGRFELANRGTLFLDEVGDIPPELQPKLLRVLQEQEFERLGSTRTQKVDVRLIAATNCDLEQMVADKRYRSDLYYRLNVFPVTIPPLRERREDIPALVRFFTQKYSRRLKKQVTAIPTETLAALTAYNWPGNVRELEHFIERAVILTRNSELRISPSELKATEATPATPLATLHDAERDHILRALEATNWVIGGPGGAASRLGMKRSTLQSRMQKLGISRRN